MRTLLAWLVAAALSAAFFQCTNLDVGNGFYDLSSLDYTFQESFVEPTPPTTSNVTVYLNPCGPIDEAVGCPPDTQLCVVKQITTADGKTLTSELKPFANQLESNTSMSVSPLYDSMGVMISYDSSPWGQRLLSASVAYECETKFALKSFEELPAYGSPGISARSISLTFTAPAACSASKSPIDGPEPTKPNNPKPPVTQKGGWGFFTWLGFILVLAFVLYGLATVYLNYQASGSGPRLEDWAEVVRDLPYLVRDFVRKIVSTFGTRGGYSAI